jgi:hypothetical protein
MVENSKILNALILLCFGITLSFVFLLPKQSYAQNHEESNVGCAPDTWTAMANRAAMETRREDVMNKRYIVKADSVLQYSCFNKELVRSYDETSRIFSNGEHWVNREVALINGFDTLVNIYGPNSPTILHKGVPNGYTVIPGAGTNYKKDYVLGETTLGFTSMDFHIRTVVGQPLLNYIDQNFSHNVLSDTTDLNFNNICYNMSDVWKAAKCKNFDGIATFYSFEALGDVPNFLTSPDPREFPYDMKCDES